VIIDVIISDKNSYPQIDRQLSEFVNNTTDIRNKSKVEVMLWRLEKEQTAHIEIILNKYFDWFHAKFDLAVNLCFELFGKTPTEENLDEAII
jgi:hypothetical protein